MTHAKIIQLLELRKTLFCTFSTSSCYLLALHLKTTVFSHIHTHLIQKRLQWLFSEELGTIVKLESLQYKIFSIILHRRILCTVQTTSGFLDFYTQSIPMFSYSAILRSLESYLNPLPKATAAPESIVCPSPVYLLGGLSSHYLTSVKQTPILAERFLIQAPSVLYRLYIGLMTTCRFCLSSLEAPVGRRPHPVHLCFPSS